MRTTRSQLAPWITSVLVIHGANCDQAPHCGNCFGATRTRKLTQPLKYTHTLTHSLKYTYTHTHTHTHTYMHTHTHTHTQIHAHSLAQEAELTCIIVFVDCVNKLLFLLLLNNNVTLILSEWPIISPWLSALQKVTCECGAIVSNVPWTAVCE